MSPVSASSVMGGSDHESVDTIILSEDLIESILKKKPGGEVVIKEYSKTKSLTDCTRLKMINILVSAMTETHGTSPPRSVRETFAQGIISLFPYLKDPYTTNGYIEQDFVLLFGEGTSVKFLERWPTTFKEKIIILSKTLSKATQGAELQELIQMAESAVDEGADTNADGWDGDFSCILPLLHLTPPSSQGRRRPGMMSASQAEQHLVIFQKAGTSIQEHLDVIDQFRQPYLLAVGTRESSVDAYFIILDKRALPCKSTSTLGASDELFKTHFVFDTAYNTMLRNMHTFIQTTVYNIDIGKVKETSRVAELRAFLKMEFTLIWKMDYILRDLFSKEKNALQIQLL
ncbi:uncharacterized protein LOC115149023 isoform X2 [Salmo trutta]|nr:uncharacterized protein LOC115149023 isoform X2 [Salmo trutta]